VCGLRQAPCHPCHCKVHRSTVTAGAKSWLRSAALAIGLLCKPIWSFPVCVKLKKLFLEEGPKIGTSRTSPRNGGKQDPLIHTVVNEAMDEEQTLIRKSINGTYTTQVSYIMRGPLVLEVYSHEATSFPVPAVSLTLYTSLLVHSAVLEIAQ
jgi:hypothetical protein